MTTVSAAVPQNRNKFTLAAAVGVLEKKETPVEFGDYTNFDTVNRFFRYQQLIKSTPYASIGMKKLKTSLTKGMDFDGKSNRQVEESRKWKKKSNLVGQAQNVAGSLFRDGFFAGILNGENPDKLKLRPLLAPYLTILPDGVKPGDTTKKVLQPDPALFVINEGIKSGDAQETPYEADKVIYGAIDEWDSKQLDLKNRETYGLYGESLVDPVELPIRYLHVINQGYVEFVKKYGMGRYSYSFPFMEMLVEKGIIKLAEFQKEIKDWMEANKNLGQNEDLVGIAKATPVDAKGSLDVMAFKTALETDIQIGFLQSDLSMGDSKGSTYAAGYVSENSRMVVLENLQLNLQNIMQDYIDKRLELQNKTPGSIEIIFDELSLPQMTAQDMLEWCNSGKITDDELRHWGGFPSKQAVTE
ncbi:MAG: hypothetical protein PHW84_02030 [Methanosarcina sp.]|nr:hypothetical protein [Methanosarcina sp.]